MNEQKLKEVFSDEEFVKSLMELETPEEVQKALEDKDIDISVDEIRKISEMLQKKADGELSDDELEGVAGGFEVLTGLLILSCVTAGATLTHGLTSGRW